MRGARAGLAALVIALFGSATGTARAEYCRTKACDRFLAYNDVWQTEPDPPCAKKANDCSLEGTPLYWPGRCLSFAVQKDGSPKYGIEYETLHEVVVQAFDTWRGADCGGAPPSMRIDDFGAVTCNLHEYTDDQGGANIVMFRDDDWPPAYDPMALALTTVTYNPETGEIRDADIELNGLAGDFTVSDDPAETRDDLLAILTHETGHFLGLAHDNTPEATMYANYNFDGMHPFGQRDLEASDIEGICAIYPPEAPVSQAACVPPHGFSRTCSRQIDPGDGCGVTRRRNADGTLTFVAVLGFAAALRRRYGARRGTNRYGAGTARDTTPTVTARAPERAGPPCG